VLIDVSANFRVKRVCYGLDQAFIICPRAGNRSTIIEIVMPLTTEGSVAPALLEE